VHHGGVVCRIVDLLSDLIVGLPGWFVDQFDKVIERMFLPALNDVVKSSVTCCVHVEAYFSLFRSFSFVLVTEVVGGVVFSTSTVKTYCLVRVVHFHVDMEVVTEVDSVHRSIMLELSLVIAILDGPFGSVDWWVDSVDFLSSFDQR
jgi:hypothetical protein